MRHVHATCIAIAIAIVILFAMHTPMHAPIYSLLARAIVHYAARDYR